MSLDRRQFLGAIAAGSAGFTLDTLPGFGSFISPFSGSGYGPVAPAAAETTGEVLLGVPAGFRYTVLSRSGERMSDGNTTPEKPDGMAAFNVDGMIRLVRNQEKSGASLPIAPFSPSYDKYAGGGCTTLIVDPVSRRLVADFVSLNGTFRNCNGGATPRGTWISGEETVAGEAQMQTRPHGYCFEVPAAANGPVVPLPLKAMGRFVHEAAVTDAATGIVYLTEDAYTSGFYRFLPHRHDELAAGGRLQMLVVDGREGADLVEGVVPGETLPVRWVDIGDPDPADAEARPDAVFQQGRAQGGASFRNLEGAVFARGSVYFAATDGGAARLGQIWRYTARRPWKRRAVASSQPASSDSHRSTPASDGVLTLLHEATDRNVLAHPDNLCIGPSGSLLMCEDGGGRPQSLRVYTARGEIFELVRNLVPGYEDTELAGATFSPDGSTLFLNALSAGLTFAIWGPW